MSDFERGACRADGALSAFMADMRAKLEREGRSEEYKANFWETLKDKMADFCLN